MLKVAIDAGHYFYTSGKRCLASLDPKQTREWVLNSRIGDKLQRMLEYYDCETLRVDDVTGETFIDLDERGEASNKWGADVYLSIHHNAGANGTTAGGTVVYWYSSVDEREEQAEGLYNSIVNETYLVGNRADPVQYKSYAILRYVDAPAFLLENGFMDSQIDTPIILTDDHAEKTAKGLVDFLVDYFGLVRIADEPTEETDEDEGYEQFKRYMEKYNRELQQLPPSEWSVNSRTWAEMNGIIKGTENGMAYKAPLTREEYVEMEYRQRNA